MQIIFFFGSDTSVFTHLKVQYLFITWKDAGSNPNHDWSLLQDFLPDNWQNSPAKIKWWMGEILKIIDQIVLLEAKVTRIRLFIWFWKFLLDKFFKFIALGTGWKTFLSIDALVNFEH